MRVTAMAMTTVCSPAPRPLISNSARISVGNDIRISSRRWLVMSTRPPMKPLTTPQVNPTVSPISTEESATTSVTWAPYTTRLKTSRPRWSVPNKCAADGGSRVAL